MKINAVKFIEEIIEGNEIFSTKSIWDMKII